MTRLDGVAEDVGGNKETSGQTGEGIQGTGGIQSAMSENKEE